jgi:hypothetical protein
MECADPSFCKNKTIETIKEVRTVPHAIYPESLFEKYLLRRAIVKNPVKGKKGISHSMFVIATA